jgi:hypothetical protein
MARTSSNSSKSKRRCRLRIEALEDRSVPATSILNAAHVFTITNDVGESAGVTVEKSGSTYLLKIDTDKFSNPGSDDDIVLSNGDQWATLSDVNSLIFNLGDGDDSIDIGKGSLDSFVDVTVLGAGGTDTLTVNDETNTATSTFSVTNTKVARTAGSVNIDYSTIAAVVLKTGTKADTIIIPSTAAGIPVSIVGGGGNDNITVGSTSAGVGLNDLLAAVSVDGGTQDTAAGDQLLLTDASNGAIQDYTITGINVTRSGATPVTVNYTGLEKLTLTAGSKNDTVAIASTTTPVTVNGSNGDDIFTAGAPIVGLNDLLASVSIVGGGNAGAGDSLIVDDGAAAVGQQYGITLNTVTRTAGSVAIGYDTIENATLAAGAGDDTIGVTSTASGTALTVNAGDGNDTITAGRLDDLDGALTVNGQVGAADQLVVDDGAETAANTYTISDTTVSRAAGSVDVDYLTVEGLVLKTGSVNDTIAVTDTVTDTPVTVNGGSGNDTVTAGTGANGLDHIRSAVSVDGGAGTADRLVVNDASTDTPQDYTVSATAVSRTGAPAVTIQYSATEQVSLAAGTKADTIAVVGSAVDSQVTVNGGAGNDTFTVGSVTMGLSDLFAPVSVVGGAGTGAGDAFVVSDGSTASSQEYSITSTTMTRVSGSVSIDYATVEQVSLAAGSKGDLIRIAGVASGSPITVSAGDGDDTVNVGDGDLDNIVGALVLDPGAGVDLLVVDDTSDTFARSYVVDADVIGRGSKSFGYKAAGFKAVALSGGTKNDTITISDTAAGIPVTMGGGGGSDTITIEKSASPIHVSGGDGSDTITAATGQLSDLGDTVSIDGGAASDRLIVNDASDSTGNTYSISGIKISRTNGTPVSIDYSGIEGVSLTSGSGGDSISIGGGSLDGLAGVVTIAAGGGTDTLTLDDSVGTDPISYTVSATSVTRGVEVFPYTGQAFERLVLSASGGDNAITVSNTASSIPVTVNGGSGNDTVTVGRLDNIDGGVTINGDAGTADSVKVDDSADPAGDEYKVSDTKIERTADSVAINYGTAEFLSLSTGAGTDTVGIHATAAGTATSIDAGAANDTVTIDTLDAIGGPVTVNGSGDAGSGLRDVLTVDDSADMDTHSYLVEAGKFTRDMLTVNYVATESLTLKTGTIGSTIDIFGSATGTNVSVVGGAGIDTVTAGNGSLDDLVGPITINATGTDNALHVNDSTDSDDNTYLVTPMQITRLGALPGPNFELSYAEFSSLSLEAGKENNTITVAGTTTAKTTVNGGTGQDTFNVTGAGLAASSTNTFNGGAEAGPDGDLFTISPSVTANISVDGGGPGAGTSPGDVLFAKSLTQPIDAGVQIEFGVTANPIAYTNFENIGFDTPAISLFGTATPDDLLVVSASGSDAGSYKLNSGKVVLFQNVTSFKWDGGNGADIMQIVNPATGLFAPSGGVEFVSEGDPGDKLEILGGTATTGVFEVGPIAGDVRVTHVNGAATLAVKASGLPTANPVLDTVQEPIFTVHGTDAANQIDITDDRVAVATFVPVDFLNKNRLVVRGGDITPGSDANDTINVDLGNSTLPGAAGVDIFSEEGADAVNIHTVPNGRNYTVDGGTDDDVTTLGRNGSLDFVLGAGTVAGGLGTDALVLDDLNDLDGNTYTVTSTNVARAAIVTTYGAMAALVLNAGVMNDTANIRSTALGTPVTVNGGGGVDTVNVSSDAPTNLGNLNALDAPVRFNGGGELDVLNISEAGAIGGDTVNVYSVGANIIGTAGGGWTVNTGTTALGGGINITTGIGADNVTIAATFVGEPVAINTGIGSDTVTAGGGTLDNLLETLTLAAGGAGGTDFLVVDDSLDSTANTYAITNAAVTRSNGTVLSFDYVSDGFERLDLRGGAAADRITIISTLAGVPVTVNGGDSDDTVVAGTGNFDNLLANVTLDGGSGTGDRLNLDDSASASANNYTVTSTTLVRAGLTVGYSAFEAFALTAGNGTDTISVLSSAAGVPVTVNGGGGDDTVIAGGGTLDNLLGNLTPDGGAGSANLLRIDDSADSDNNAYAITTTTVSRNGSPINFNYTSSFQSMSLLAGTGNDTIDSSSSTTIPASADGGGGNDTFTLGFLNGNIIGGAGGDTIVGDNGNRTYTLTGANAGTLGSLLGGGFTAIENLTAGSGADTFAFSAGGSLSGIATGGAGRDILRGDNVGRTFTLTASNAGNVGTLVGSFNGFESLVGGSGNDTLAVAAGVPADGLARFDGAGGTDTADFTLRTSAQNINIRRAGSIDGVETNGGTFGVSPIVTEGLFNINRILGSASSATDSLSGIDGVAAATWQVSRSAGVGDNYTAAGSTVGFKNFEDLIGNGANDTFRVDYSSGDSGGPRLLLQGGGGADSVVAVGGDSASSFALVQRNKNWPLDVTDPKATKYAGLTVNRGTPVLYDAAIKTLDLQGGAGNDTFLIDPGVQKAKRPKGYISLYGAGVQRLLLEGGGGGDTFSVVPDRPGLSATGGVLPGVRIEVYGSTQDQPSGLPASPNDVLNLYRLPAKYKANFPVAGGKGPSTSKGFNLGSLGYKPVWYFDMWTVTANITPPTT